MQADRRVADRVHAGVEAMQPPAPEPPLDCDRPEADRNQLPMSNHPVLASRQAGGRSVGWVIWRSDSDFEMTHPFVRPGS
jgi:hypothetical protein